MTIYKATRIEEVLKKKTLLHWRVEYLEFSFFLVLYRLYRCIFFLVIVGFYRGIRWLVFGLALGFHKALIAKTHSWRKQLNFSQALEEEKHGA